MNKHKEKHKNDVKENEKTCGQHAQNLGTEAKNRLFGRAKSGVGKNGHPSILDSGASFANKAKNRISSNPQLSPSTSFLRVQVLSLLNWQIN